MITEKEYYRILNLSGKERTTKEQKAGEEYFQKVIHLKFKQDVQSIMSNYTRRIIKNNKQSLILK